MTTPDESTFITVARYLTRHGDIELARRFAAEWRAFLRGTSAAFDPQGRRHGQVRHAEEQAAAYFDADSEREQLLGAAWLTLSEHLADANSFAAITGVA